MKHVILLLLFLQIAFLSFSNDPDSSQIRRSILTIENGIRSRGLIGLGYTRNFGINQNTFLSLHISQGLGNGPYGFPNLFTTIAPAINIGNPDVFSFKMGFGLKRVSFSYREEVSFFKVRYYDGLAYSIFMGWNEYMKGRFHFSGRASLFFFKQDDPSATGNGKFIFFPGLSFSMGLQFGKFIKMTA